MKTNLMRSHFALMVGTFYRDTFPCLLVEQRSMSFPPAARLSREEWITS